MAGDFSHRIVYRKDERGVILESAVVGPDDEMPEGFEESAEYQSYVPKESEAPAVEESKLTAWEGVDLSQTVDAIKGEAEVQEGSTDPAGLRSGEDTGVGDDDKIGVAGTVKQTDQVVTADDGSSEFGSDQTVDEILGDRQEGSSDPRGENSDDEGAPDEDRKSRRGRNKASDKSD